ncbi:MAG TPA: UDP-N-acetylmuramoyl-tripeptide--D-alanyl-D-alanine ligase [Syntrophomonadaceae bacterium]|nr:UDP-N-acetylmuramoyl-tripeptide--D-alanyl-D-alanine ligase [Syntrophomonadaceae bacterium]
MEPLQIDDVIRAVDGLLVSGNPKGEVTGVAIDSRAVEPGQLFFAFQGSRVDGHGFIGEALQRGAIGAVISKPVLVATDRPLIRVRDTCRALQDLARYYRNLFRVPVVAVTGSVGKTTTKDLIAGVLSRRFSVLKTRGNYNNEIGLPLTLLQLTRRHEVAVLEMAMRGRGEIAALCRIGSPQVGVITCIGRTHLERLGSQEAIARAKGELLDALPPEGCAVLNAGDPWQIRLRERVKSRVLYYGESENCDVRALEVRLLGLEGATFMLRTPLGDAPCHLPFPGRHNVLNALAAAAVGHWFGLTPQEIAAGLASASMTGMRLEVKKGIRGSRIIDDSYNASPDSVKAALRLLAQVPDKTRAVAVLGDMYELGTETVPGHREVGKAAAELKIDCLCTVGELAREIAFGACSAGMSPDLIHVFENRSQALEFLKSYLEEGDLVLIKGSRGIKMEEVSSALTEQVSHDECDR